jgi:hypothetical protein
MAVISIQITESDDQVSSGIPRLLTITSNIVCNIFYTFDGSDPDFSSSIYTHPIVTPSNLNPLIFKVFATNGIDSTAIITQEYSSNISDGVRLSRPTTSADVGESSPNRYPFGTGPIDLDGQYVNSSNSGQTVNDPSLDQIPNGYDGQRDLDGYTNLPYTSENYNIKYSTTDSLGQYGKGIGTLPGNTGSIPKTSPPEETDRYSSFFDPRAMVIFQDVSKENPDDPPQINRQFFTLNSDSSYYGDYLYNTGADVIAPSGSFVKSHYNPKDNTITYYYYDNSVNKWIISKTEFKSKSPNVGQLYNIFAPRDKSLGFVFQWRMFTRRVLF